jgi:N-formylglutamate deformylase
MDSYRLHRGNAPLLISAPHDGSQLPDALHERMTASAWESPDTDWHIARLYEFALEMGASMIVPRWSRYVIDLNRPPDDNTLYPGQNTTGLCPTVQFSGDPIYLPGQEPDRAEMAERIDTYWRPYHEALSGELARIKGVHGRVVLWEAHSIRSRLPFLFEGRLPVFNLGTAGGTSCASALEQALTAVLAAQDEYDHVVNGRFKGGYITRHYGASGEGVDAVQLELAQRAYLDESDSSWRSEKAALVTPILRALLNVCLRQTTARRRPEPALRPA